jgi:hypothetical protein
MAVVVIIGANFADGLGASGWNNPAAGWLSPGEKRDLDALRSYLAKLGEPDRPVVFVVDNKPPAPFQIYGFTKLAGNTSRYGLPAGQIDRGYLYLGSLGALLASQPTLTGDGTYDRLSKGFLADAKRGIAASGQRPIVVVDYAFNASGANAQGPLPSPSASGLATEWVTVGGGQVGVGSEPAGSAPAPVHASRWHLLVVLLGLIALLLPGLLAVEWFLPGASVAEMLGMVPALSMALLALIGIAALAITRSPFTGLVAWICVGVAVLIGAMLRVRSRSSLPSSRVAYGSGDS